MDCRAGLRSVARTVSALAVIAMASQAHAETPQRIGDQYVPRAWGTVDGLPQNTVTSILQTRDGYLWLGTFGGLVRFDGNQFTVFDSGNSPGLGSSRIVVLLEDREGVLWIGTERGLTRFERGRFTTFTTRDGLPYDGIYSLMEDRRGRLLVGTAGGLAIRVGSRFETIELPSVGGPPAPQAIAETSIGELWIGSFGYLFRSGDDRATVYSHYSLKSDGFADDTVLCLLVDGKGRLWIGTSEGLGRWDGTRVVKVPLPGGTARHNSVLAFAEDRQGSVWIGTRSGGVYRWREGLVDTYAASDGLSNDYIRSLHTDREGNVWIGTDVGGLNRLRPRQAFTYQRGDPMAESVCPITDDGAGGLWVGATCGGLLHFKAGGFTVYTEKNGLPHNCIWALHRDPDGTLWIGTAGGGLTRFKDGRFASYVDGPATANVYAIHRDREGTLWVGTGDGLSRFDDGRFTYYGARDGLADGARYIMSSRTGALWIATSRGLSRLQDGRFTMYTKAEGLSHDHVRAVHEDADGTLWIGTYGGGLNRFRDGRFTHYGVQDGLFDSVVSRILEDDRGNFWMSGNKGVFRVARAELNAFAEGKAASITSITYGTAEGMASSETNGGGQPAGWRTSDGRLWFPTIKGLVAIDPPEADAPPLPVYIERILADRRSLDSLARADLPPGKGDFEFHYTAPTFGAPEKVRFRYRLEGHDEDWVEAGARRVAYYTNVNPGAHRFRAIAANADGVWSDREAVFEFSLAPPFYRTIPFYLACALGLVAVGVGSHRLRVAQLSRRAQALEAKVVERTSELARAKDHLEKAHDDLLSLLDQLRHGAVMTDAGGNVTFVNHAAERLLEANEDESLGRPWDQVLPLSDRDKAELREISARPAALRGKLPLEIHARGGRRYWMEIEVRNDPRDAARRIFLLYDVSEVYDLRRALGAGSSFADIVGHSKAIQLVYKQVRDVARVDTTVLIEGETGTGKELVARAIHSHSHRKTRSFVAVNCGSFTESLLGSQLFGHKRGAFTGAVADHVGLFEAAEGGTLFLDEIGDMPVTVQTSLLRVLQEREILRVGDSQPRKIDVRVIAATHRDLGKEVAAGRFREDLLYRIRVARIHVPPLRDRSEDVPSLVAWFVEQWRRSSGRPVPEIGQQAMQALIAYAWPGNVRELKGAIESAFIRAPGPVVELADLPVEIWQAVPRSAAAGLEANDRQEIVDALRRADGNRSKAARLLGVGRTTLYRRLQALGIEGDEQLQ